MKHFPPEIILLGHQDKKEWLIRKSSTKHPVGEGGGGRGGIHRGLAEILDSLMLYDFGEALKKWEELIFLGRGGGKWLGEGNG